MKKSKGTGNKHHIMNTFVCGFCAEQVRPMEWWSASDGEEIVRPVGQDSFSTVQEQADLSASAAAAATPLPLPLPGVAKAQVCRVRVHHVYCV